MKHLQAITTLIVLSWSVLASGQGYTLNGNAVALGGDCYAVTPAVNFQNGTIWYNDVLNLTQPFDIQFYMNFGNVDAEGADGMVFVLQQIGVNALGINGSGMGYQGFNNSFGVEFDTYSNNADPFTGQNMNDPLFDHVAFIKNGDVNHASANNLAGPVQASSTSANIEDGQDHIVRLTWEPSTHTITLYFDCILRLTADVNLLATIFNSGPLVYFGFTGSTGGFNNLQQVCLQPNIIPTDDNLETCAGQAVQLSAGGDATATFSWTPTDYLDDPSAQNPICTPDESISYTVTYSDLCGNPVQKNVNVDVTPSPTIDAGFDASLCEGLQMQLNGSSDLNTGILWTTTDGNILAGNATLTPTINTGGTYTLTVTTPDGCSSTDEVVVENLQNPIVDLGENFSVCEGETATLTIANSFASIEWNTGETTASITAEPGPYSVTVQSADGCESTDNITIGELPLPVFSLGADIIACETEPVFLTTPQVATWSTGVQASQIEITQSGNYSATIDQNGCVYSDDITVTIFTNPQVELGNDILLCEGSSTIINAGQIGEWSTGVIAPSIEVFNEGIYSVVITNGPCSVSDFVEVFFTPLPRVDLGNDVTVCNDANFTLSAGDYFIEEYLWSTGDETAFIRPTESGEYFVDVINECGSASDTIYVEVQECNYYIYVPNAFTPDNDGLNDYWQISTFKVPQIEIFIFNRWGQQVFYTNDPAVPWLGDFNGNGYYLEDGIYTYYIKYIAFNSEADTMTGHITLLR